MRSGEGKTAWKQGFTLIELLVVIGIIVILMLVAIPALNAIFANASLTMAENQLRAAIAQARSLAIRDRRMVGLVFFEPDPGLDQTAFKDRATQGDRTAYQFIVYDHAAAGIDYFAAQIAIEDADPNNSNAAIKIIYRAPEYLPRGLRVGTLDDAANKPLRTEFSSADTKARAILFDSSGQLVLRNRMAMIPTMGGRTEWNLNATTANPSDGVSSPGFVIYDTNKLRNSVDITNLPVDTTKLPPVYEWIFQNSNIYVINAYTGGIVR